MANLGLYIAMLGIGSFVLHFFDYEFKLLMWVDHWGTGTGNLIRIGMIVGGIGLYLIGDRKKEKVSPEDPGQNGNTQAPFRQQETKLNPNLEKQG